MHRMMRHRLIQNVGQGHSLEMNVQIGPSAPNRGEKSPATGDAENAASRATLESLHPAAWRWALVCCRGDEELAMEALHESYLKLLDGRARYDKRSSLKTFVFGVIRLTALTARRKAAVRRLFFAPLEHGQAVAAAPTQETSTRTRRVDAALAGLPQRQREVIELVLLRDFTVDEAAHAMGVSRGAASRHYAAAKSRVRAVLDADGAGQ